MDKSVFPCVSTGVVANIQILGKQYVVWVDEEDNKQGWDEGTDLRLCPAKGTGRDFSIL